jgi:hypothetical protein
VQGRPGSERGRDRPFLRARYAGSPELRRERAAARAYGVSRKRLLGWEPTERHEHFDAEHNLIGYTIVTRDVEFDDDEQAEVIAYEEMLDNQCPGCGGQLDETTDPDMEGEYVGSPPTRCFRCDAIAVAQEPYMGVDAHGKPKTRHPQALLWEVHRR